MTLSFRKWAYGLVAGTIGGAATAVAATFGLGAAQAMGVAVHPLDLRQFGMVVLTGIISNGVLYLRQSPLPPMESDTDYFADWSAKRLVVTPPAAQKADKP